MTAERAAPQAQGVRTVFAGMNAEALAAQTRMAMTAQVRDTAWYAAGARWGAASDPATAGFGVMMLAFWVAHFVWLPRITRRRYEAEFAEDPVGAAAAHRRRRLQARLGFGIGALLGGAAVLASWFF